MSVIAREVVLNDTPCRLLLTDGNGVRLSKTLTAIAIAGKAYLEGHIKRLLVVAPASVVSVWPQELTQHAAFPYEAIPLTGAVKKRMEALKDLTRVPRALQVVVINYEVLAKMETALIAWRPDMVIYDESQRLKTPSSQQSQAAGRISRYCKFRLGLTGTPVTQGPLDFWAQYRAIDPSIFGTSFYNFKNRYAVLGGFNQKQVVGYRNLPELIVKAHSIAYRVTKEEALDLPEYIDQLLYCELEPEAAKVYRQLARDSVAELERDKHVTAANVLARLLRLSQVTGGFVNDVDGRGHQVSRAKLSLLEELLEDLLVAEKKCVCFYRFTDEGRAIEELVKTKLKVGYARIAGDVPMAARGELVRQFQEDPECMVFLAQIQSAGLGITLTTADTAIFYSLDFSFANYDQARARIHRLGQRNACTYIHLIAQGSVDEKIMQALAQKRSMADQVVDGWRDYFDKE